MSEKEVEPTSSSQKGRPPKSSQTSPKKHSPTKEESDLKRKLNDDDQDYPDGNFYSKYLQQMFF